MLLPTVRYLGSESEENEEVGRMEEEAPQIAAVIDERPAELRSFAKTFKSSEDADENQPSR